MKKNTNLALELRKYKRNKRILILTSIVISIIIIILYFITSLYFKRGGFTVQVNKYHSLNYGLSLCESSSFNTKSAQLNTYCTKTMTNIDGDSLSTIDFGAVDGNDSGENYLCYTFYCKNTGNEILNFNYRLLVSNATLDIEKAIRIRLISVDNKASKQSVDFARAAGVDENGKAIPETYPIITKPFYSKEVVCNTDIVGFYPDDVMKFTVVLWLEGNDQDCVDSIMGGSLRLSMFFEVTSHSEI